MRDALLDPRKSQWLVLAATLIVVIPVIVYLNVPNDAALVLVRQFELPALQASLGFTADRITLPPTSGTRAPVFAITAVTPGGAFWRAGVRPGDVPTGYKHGLESGFLWDLIWGKKEGSVTLRFVPAEAVGKGRWHEERTVTVIYPKT
jgi:hypothetical protein